jgi:hypothetical protein
LNEDEATCEVIIIRVIGLKVYIKKEIRISTYSSKLLKWETSIKEAN